jgi:hypothetical protein
VWDHVNYDGGWEKSERTQGKETNGTYRLGT